MAAPSVTTPDTLISLKINYDGVTKKLRMPIRDLGASSIENKVCISSAPVFNPAFFPRYQIR